MIIVDMCGRAIDEGDEVVMVKPENVAFTVIKCTDLLEQTPDGPRRILAMSQTRLMAFAERTIMAPVYIIKKAEKTASSLLS